MDFLSRARLLKKSYKEAEAGIIALLIEMQRANAFIALGFQGIFSFCKDEMALADEQAAYFRRVVMAAIEIPTLEKAVTDGTLTLSQARRIVPVVNEKNAETWIEAAQDLTQKELEQAVASVNPNAAKVERLKPVSADSSELRLTLPQEVADMLRRVQDLEAQRTGETVSLEQTLAAALQQYITKNDPIEKAKRSKKVLPQEATKSIPAAVKHAVVLRDQNRCTHPGCQATRWLEISRSYTS